MQIPFQNTSHDIWDKKYRLRDSEGNPIDSDPMDSRHRVALALAQVEGQNAKKNAKQVVERFYLEFCDAMDNGAIPAGRIYSNAGASEHKRAVSLINCLSGDTQVLTQEYGVVRISYLAGKTVHVVNGNGDWSKVTFKSYGIQTTYPLNFSRLNTFRCNETVRATLGHRWVLESGRVVTTEFFTSADELPRGYTRLPNVVAPKQKLDVQDYQSGILHGLVYGDGCARPTEGDDKFQLDLINEKRELSSLVEKILDRERPPYSVKFGETSEGLRFASIHSETDLKALPEQELSLNYSYLRGFFAGILASDGSVDQNGKGASDVLVYGSKELIKYLVRYLPLIGLLPMKYSRFAKKGSKTNLSKRTRDVWVVHIHTHSIQGRDVLRSLHKSKFITDGEMSGLSFSTWKLTGWEDDPVEEEVFCCEEPVTHSFVLGSGLLTGNCTVSDTIQDSMDSILGKLHEAGMTLKAGCGIGYEFSSLRPKGSFVYGAGASTSGPLSFMDIYDAMCFTVASAGGRRGAQMGTFDISHPDVMDFIKAKREDGRLRQFNLSVLITDKFMEAVRNDAPWQFMWEGNPAGSAIPARKLWDTIMESNYNFAEPGFILVDKINHYNNLWFCEELRATNPCGEQPLPPYGACLLGSVNLTAFVDNPFTERASFNFNKFEKTVATFTRMLDNVVEISGLPLPQQVHEIQMKRRHGMGFLGLGSTLTMLGMTYGDARSVDFTSVVTRKLAMVGFMTGVELAKEKGEAPVLKNHYKTSNLLGMPNAQFNINFTNKADKFDSYTGRALMLMSHYFDTWRDTAEGGDILREMTKHGCRFSHHSSIAPTGTISLSLGNNCSNGIEPTFSHHYVRNVIREGKNAKEAVDVYSYEFLLYKTLVEQGKLDHVVSDDVAEAMKAADLDPLVPHPSYMPKSFSTTDSISPRDHVLIQAAAQRWIDSSISKTINVPTDIPLDEFKGIYLDAYEKGLKGCTTFRFNPEAFSGVLVKKDDLKNTRYTFVLANGEEKSFSGDTLIEYEGQTHTAANLYDSIKEGYYGKF